MSVVEVGPDYFACRCSDDSAAEVDWIVGEANRILGPKTTPESFLSHAVYVLEWAYRAEITGIACDQWCLVSASTYDRDVKPPAFSTGIECDAVEDGIAATIVAFYQRYGDKRPRGDEG